jgi:tRNA dimethylallyltransferase
VLQSIGYREATTVLRGTRTEEQAIGDLVRSTRRFAKRQLTWFRAESDAVWIHPRRHRERAVALVADLVERAAAFGRRDFARDPE